MKKYIYISVALLMLIGIFGFAKHLDCKNIKKDKQPKLFADVTQTIIAYDQFHGIGFIQDLTDDKTTTDLRITNVQLAPNSYLDWHSLPGGNTIIVTEGNGYYQTKGKSVIKVQKGDKLETTPGLPQWLGAASDSKIEFISITIKKADDLIQWHEVLNPDTYKKINVQKQLSKN